MKRIIICVTTIFLIVSCNSNFKRENSEQDISDAKEECDKYLNFFVQNNLDSAYSMTNGISQTDFKLYNHKTDSLHGGMKQYKYLEGGSLVEQINNVITGEYTLVYKVERERRNTQSIIYLKYVNGKIKITGGDEKFEL
ncbi:MAG: hypothetical protein IM600_10815 [Bacteroidetes bacterium]|nr:hypothetical protein [Bacteroidota bacterium]MCA6443910.1 hypothetical protein [Bacteroidota bacterium]